MKARIIVVLCVALVEGCVSVNADDTPDQAAARAALGKKMYELDHPNTRPAARTNSVAVAAKPAHSTTNATHAASAKVAAHRIAPAKTIPAAAPATKAPATVAPAKAAPASTAPVAATFTPETPAANASAQATALAALQQKMRELNQPKTRPSPDINSVAVAAKPAHSTTNATHAASAKVAAHRTAPAKTIPAAAPATKAPATLAPAKATPASTAPADATFVPEVPTANASAQATALAALQQKMRELNQPETRPSPDINSAAVAAKPAHSTTNTTHAASAKVAAHRTAPAKTIPVAAPATKAPATVAPAKAAQADATFAPEVPAANASAQATALTAVKQKMHELNQPEAQPVTETPTAQAPVAISPGMAPSVVAPLSAAPAVVAPAPKISTEPAAAASVAIVPVAAAEPVVAPTRTQPATAPVMLKPASAPQAATLPSSSPGQRPANELVTTTGFIYKNVEVLRVKEDAIVISYRPANGGWAMTNISFQDLPIELRQQYGK